MRVIERLLAASEPGPDEPDDGLAGRNQGKGRRSVGSLLLKACLLLVAWAAGTSNPSRVRGFWCFQGASDGMLMDVA